MSHPLVCCLRTLLLFHVTPSQCYCCVWVCVGTCLAFSTTFFTTWKMALSTTATGGIASAHDLGHLVLAYLFFGAERSLPERLSGPPIEPVRYPVISLEFLQHLVSPDGPWENLCQPTSIHLRIPPSNLVLRSSRSLVHGEIGSTKSEVGRTC